MNDARGVMPVREALNVTIIESQSLMSGHDMDQEWLAVATAMGHVAAIAGQSTLDDIANLAGADILIVSSGIIYLPAQRVQTIEQFLVSGRPVYLQGEYMCDYSPNLAFGQIVTDLGGSYTPLGSTSGMLEPMDVLGTLATDPNAVPVIYGFWYGCAGAGDGTLESFLRFGGQDFGFVFTPPAADQGIMIFDTDQDWVREADERPTSVVLMENILTYLGAHGSVAVEASRWGDLKALYR